MKLNLVEFMAAGEDADCAFDQPCAHGHRVDRHAVYCHNTEWDDAPRKCRRGKWGPSNDPHEDCPGYALNPAYRPPD